MNTSGDLIVNAPCLVIEPEEQAVALLEDGIHEIAQPLTALSFILDLALLGSDPQAWREALVAAQKECRRAVVALNILRANAFADAAVVPASDMYSGDLP